jgi:hypothetical protein
VNPRLSIIPAGAVTDRSLEPRDLQVLCLLGRHTDRLGWCMRSQVRMAGELYCSRSSVQRSLERLCEAGWVEKKRRDAAAATADPGQPSSSYAYRVVLDRDDFAFETANEHAEESHAGNADRRDGCPPVGSPSKEENAPGGAHPRRAPGAQPYAGTGCPAIHGHQERLLLTTPLERDEIGDARARSQSSFTEGSKALATAFWKAVGFDNPLDIPPEFAGVDWRAIKWEAAGWTVDLIDAEARKVARDLPLKPLSYFEKVFATSFAKRQTPLPIVKILDAEKLTVTSHGKTQAASYIRQKVGFAGIAARLERSHSDREADRPAPEDLEPINGRRNPA